MSFFIHVCLGKKKPLEESPGISVGVDVFANSRKKVGMGA
jgi:hypothetical protein